MKKHIPACIFALLILSGTANAARILVVGDNGASGTFNRDQNAFAYNTLLAEGHAVTHSLTIPATIDFTGDNPSGYDQLWVFGGSTMPVVPGTGPLPMGHSSAAWSSPIAGFIQAGGGGDHFQRSRLL